MSAPKSPYRKLTRMSRSIGTMTQLWLGPDHLMQVQSTGYTENYQRFYLRDIQALLVVHTARRTYFALALASLGLIVSLIVLAADGGWLGHAITWGALLPFLLWNHLLGPGCRVVVITAVQQEKIPSLARRPKTRRVLAELKPLIEAAQRDLTMPAAAVVHPGEGAGLPPLLPSAVANAPAGAARAEPPALPPPLPVP